MKYEINEYKTNKDNSVRFTLGLESNNPLIVIGVNPSTADENVPDNTVRRVLGFARRGMYNGFLMLNLCPIRATKPYQLPKECSEDIYQNNLKHIEEIFKRYEGGDVLLAFGDSIMLRDYLKQSLKDIIPIGEKYNVKWKCIKLNKSGYPQHPLMPKYQELKDLDITKFK